MEVIRPGACALAARGPARYFGGEEPAAERIVEQVAQACAVESQVGIADGVFAAGLAARAGQLVAAGADAGVPRRRWTIAALDRPDADRPAAPAGHRAPSATSRRCPPATCWPGSASTRRCAHRLAGGRRPAPARGPPAAARPGRDRRRTTSRWSGSTWPRSPPGRSPSGCTSGSAGHGLACTRLGIEAVTAARRGAAPGLAARRAAHRGGDRRPGALAARRLADRHGRRRRRPDAGPTAGHRPAAAGPRRGAAPRSGCSRACGARPARSGERAHRALSRVQGLLGPEAVVTAVLGGGRVTGRPGAPGAVGRRARPGPTGGRAATRRSRGAAAGRRDRRRPGPAGCRRPRRPRSLPQPLPAMVHDAAGDPVGGQRPAGGHARAPARLAVGTAAAGGDRRLGRAVAGRRALVGAGGGAAAGPVPGRPWPTGGRCCCRCPAGRWCVEAVYD